MRVKFPFELSNLDPGDPQFVNFVSQMINSIVGVLNGEVSFSDNFKAKIVSVTFNAANTQQSIQHGLNKTPTGYLRIGSKVVTHLFDGTTPNTSQVIYLQSTVATTVNVLIF